MPTDDAAPELEPYDLYTRMENTQMNVVQQCIQRGEDSETFNIAAKNSGETRGNLGGRKTGRTILDVAVMQEEAD